MVNGELARRCIRPRGPMLPFVICVILSLSCVSCQFRAGHITWRPVGPNTVELSVKTAWVRSAGTYVKIVGGSPAPQTGYQPVKGDVINILGFETPKIVALGTDSAGNPFEKYLQAVVTSNTESVSQTADIGKGLPHQPSDWSYYANNWIEAISTYNVTFPRRDITYPVELQGCCRQPPSRLDTTNQVQYRDGTGLLELANTPYTIRAFVRLDRDPPPISFLPSFVPFSAEGGIYTVIDLPILDFSASYLVNDPSISDSFAQSKRWPDQIVQDAKSAQGDLFKTQSRPAAGRRLQSTTIDEDDSTGLPALNRPSTVFVTAADTGNDVRMLPMDPAGNPKLLTLFLAPNCANTSQRVSIPAGMDVCPGSPVQTYPDGGAAARNFTSVLVPPGLRIVASSGCEYSTPPQEQAAIGGGVIFVTDFGSFEAVPPIATFDNSKGTAPVCYNLPAGGATALRVVQNSQQGSIRTNLLMQYRRLSSGRVQAMLDVSRFKDKQGNYPVRLRVSTNASSETTVEFVLHMITSTTSDTDQGGRYIVERAGFPAASAVGPTGPAATVVIPTGFMNTLTWGFAPSQLESGSKATFDSLGLGGFPDGAAGPTAGALGGGTTWRLGWSPCGPSVGSYFYCFYIQQLYAPYDFASIRCVYIEVVLDLPPVLHFLAPDGKDSSQYRVTMGESLSVTVRATDNYQDSIDTIAISQLNLNTGDRLRARIMYRYADVGATTGGNTHVWSVAPAVVEPALPVFLGLRVSNAAPDPPGAAGNLTSADRLLQYVPGRLHSGLEMEVCFVAVDSWGTCKGGGYGTFRCLSVSVARCKYSLPRGESLESVAGLFETNWAQLFALNPTLSRPRVGDVTKTTLINIGHLYKVEGGETGAGESAEQLRVKFGTTEGMLMALNADLTRQTAPAWTPVIPAGSVICIVPNSCDTVG